MKDPQLDKRFYSPDPHTVLQLTSQERAHAYREVTVSKYQLINYTLNTSVWAGWVDELGKWIPEHELQKEQTV